MFLGTPHSGAKIASLGTSLLQIASVYSKTNTTVLRDLRLQSTALQTQLRQYDAISSNYVTVFCYEVYETELVSGVSELVSGFLAHLLNFRTDSAQASPAKVRCCAWDSKCRIYCITQGPYQHGKI